MVYGSTRVQNRTLCLPAKKVALWRRAIYYRAQYLSRRRSSDIQTPIKVVRGDHGHLQPAKQDPSRDRGND